MQPSMNASSRSMAADFPPGLRWREIRTSFFGWGLYMAALTGYCMIHQAFVGNHSPDLQGSVIWAIREWGIWVLLTPVAFKVLRTYGAMPDRRVPAFIQLGLGVLLVSLTFRVGLDVATGAREALASLIIFFPRHLAALGVVMLVWYLFLRVRPSDGQDAPRGTGPDGGTGGSSDGNANGGSNGDRPGARRYPETILVSKGHGECLIRVDRIQCITAAGNYLEIESDGRGYLMRATMKQIEEMLPPSEFVRTHRSHIININEIDRIRTRPSGNGVVELRCGKTLSVSRKYKSQLQQYRLQPA